MKKFQEPELNVIEIFTENVTSDDDGNISMGTGGGAPNRPGRN